MNFLKQFLFFSRADKIGIFSLSAIVLILLILNVTLSRLHEINDGRLPYQPEHASVMSNDTVPDAVPVPTVTVDDTILATERRIVPSNGRGYALPWKLTGHFA